MDRKVMFVFAVIAIAAAGIMLIADDSDAAAEGEVGYRFTVGDLGYRVKSVGSGADPAEVGVCSYVKGCIVADIPAEVNGYRVTSIYISAFHGCTSLTSVIIPSSITFIDSYVFFGCASLTSVTIPASVTHIGEFIFDGCTSLTSISVESENNNYSSDASGTLFNKEKTTLIRCPHTFEGAYTVPSSVTSIDSSAFHGCTSLTSVTIPSSVTSIGYSSFRECYSLTSVTIPSSVTFIGDFAFHECDSLPFINVEPENKNYSSDAFGVLFNKDKTTLMQCPGEFKGEYTVPSSVTSIDRSAFDGCTSLTSVIIPSSVTSIDSSAFDGCTSLTSVIIPSSVTSISRFAFDGCTSLTSVTIPSSVTSIDSSAFYGCTSLTSVTIPSSVTSIGNYAFYSCTSLTSVTIPSSVTFVGGSAFGYCESMDSAVISKYVFDNLEKIFLTNDIKSLILMDDITSIGDSAFRGCQSLTSVTIPSSVTSVSGYAFSSFLLTSIIVDSENKNYSSDASGVLFNKDKTELIKCPRGFEGGYDLPLSVITIGDSAFSKCGSLSSVTIPSSVTRINNNTFSGCISLTSVTIPSSVITIGDSAFSQCGSLSSVTIPSSVITIGEHAFEYPFYSHDGSTEVKIVQGNGYAWDLKGEKYIIDSLETTIISEGKSITEFVKYGTLLKDLDLKKEGFVLDKFYSDAEHTESIPSDSAVTESGMTLYCTWKEADSPVDFMLIAEIAAAVVILALLAVILIKRRG